MGKYWIIRLGLETTESYFPFYNQQLPDMLAQLSNSTDDHGSHPFTMINNYSYIDKY